MKKYIIIFIILIIISLPICIKYTNLFHKIIPSYNTLEDAKNDNCVVLENLDITSGQSIWQNFIKDTEEQKTGTVRLVNYLTLGDPSGYSKECYEEMKDKYPVLYVKDLHYDSEKYTLSCYEDDTEIKYEYKYLLRYTGKPRKGATFSEYEYYVLINEDSYTWKEIEHGMFSSNMNDYIDFKLVYSDLTFEKEE
ncbi:hypothetical protein SH1V18_35660 [Vallitalea longa]|uniref:Uncharacterized protein n=1 Tax=Vallitalea longa TaxID=2936439 RepID=A0A9W5YEA7_9FIRM|nr:hypothetical protein [Vallitalea longa]GKX31086.1 hypothetical protein SH1V18_35660 [Vallitalea longa]